MKHLIRIALFFLFLQSASAQTFNPQLGTMLQDTLNKYCSLITNIKGMSASVYLPGHGIWKGTAGVSYAGHPVTPDMQFGIASNTKLFVSAAILKLTESHILSLDDSLHEWLPTYPNVNPNITIRQLLNHTSGVQDPIFLSPWMDTIMKHPTRVFTPNEVLSWVGAPLFNPGTNWSYSNVNYILAGMVAESATGYHISKIIRDSLLTPLNLDSTFYDVKEPVSAVLTHRWYNNVDYNDTSRVGLNTAGGCAGALFSTTGEMAQWYHALMSGQVLDTASLADLMTFVATPTAYTYGLGLEKQTWFGHVTMGHGGSTWGYKSKMIYDPCMGAVVCGLVNSWPAGMDGVTLILYKVLVDHLPGCPGAISGQATVCRNQNAVTYTIPLIPNATSYLWTLPVGATGSSSTNSIIINFGPAAVSGNIIVQGVNSYGENLPALLPVTVQSVLTGITVNDPIIMANATTAAYQWLDCDNAYAVIPGETGQTFVAPVNGNFAVEVTENGCVDTSACVDIYTIGWDENNKIEGLELFPNPTENRLNIHVASYLQGSAYFITDIQGRTILAGPINAARTTIDINGLAKGIYLLKLSGQYPQALKVIKN